MPRPRIVNLTDHWFPDKIGGSCLYAYKFHRLLADSVRVETVTLDGESSSRESDMVVHKVLHKSRFWRNRAALRKLDAVDVIWVVHSPWFFLHLFFAVGFNARNRVVGVYHGPWFREYYESAAAKKQILARIAFSGIRYVIELLYSLYVQRFIFLSETMYRATSEYLPVARSKVQVIPMWSEQEPWDRSRPSQDPLLLSTFRRLEPRMGLQDLILALNRCDIENYKLVICGDGPFKAELIQLVNRLQLQDRVELRGWVTDQEKSQLIKESDAVVIPSRSLEGFSLLALESLEKGTPVILTDAVGFYEYVREVAQDYVHKIDLDDPEVHMRQFLAMGNARSGLGRIETLFNAGRIRRALLAFLMPAGHDANDRRSVPPPKSAALRESMAEPHHRRSEVSDG